LIGTYLITLDPFISPLFLAQKKSLSNYGKSKPVFKYATETFAFLKNPRLCKAAGMVLNMVGTKKI